MLNRYNQKRKALEPLIATILLIVVSVILVTIVLTWGKEFSTSSLNKTTVVFTEADSSIYMLSAGKLQNGKLIFKNISPTNKDINIIGYKINSPFQHELLNKINYLSEPKVLGPGASAIIGIVTPPEEIFNVELYTEDQKYITIYNVKESQPTKSFASVFRDGETYFGAFYLEKTIQTNDGGYLILGSTSYNEDGASISYELWLLKIDTRGNLDWNKTFGGLGDGGAEDILSTSDKGYLILGVKTTSEENIDLWLIKIDASGNLDWNKTFGGENYEYPTQVLETNDGGYLILGNTHSENNSNIWLIKTDRSGNLDWNKTFGGSSSEEQKQVLETSDGGYLILGHTDSYGAGETDIWLLKTNSNGELDWNKTVGGENYEYPTQVLETNDGEYLILGYTYSYGAGEADIWLLKTNSNGELDWNKTFGGSDYEEPNQVLETSDGGYLILGDTQSYGAGETGIWLLKTNSNGELDWNKTFGGSNNYDSEQVFETSDGGYLIFGHNGYIFDEDFDSGNLYVIKTDNLGNIIFENTIGGRFYDWFYSFALITDGGVIAVGETTSFGGYHDSGDSYCDYQILVVKIDKKIGRASCRERVYHPV